MVTWLRVLTELRNRCAHFSRLYSWNFLSVPKNNKAKTWTMDNTLFSQIYMLKLLHPHQETWLVHLENFLALMDKYADAIDLAHIGFPDNWQVVLNSDS